MRYLRDATILCLLLGGKKPIIVDFTNIDMASVIDFIKSTLGYMVKFVWRVIT